MKLKPAVRCLNRNQLKYIAAAAMAIDHIVAFFFPLSGGFYIVCRVIGRLTAPIMCYFLAEGFYYTSSRKNYALRLFAFALIAQPAYAFVHGLLAPVNLNVLFTLLLSFCMLAVWEEVRQPLLRWALAALLIALSACGDWGITAPLWVLCFHLFRGNRARQMTAFALIAGADLVQIVLTNLLDGFVWYLNLWEAGLFLFIPLMLLYNGQRGGGGPFSKWFFYVFYPAHLLAIGLAMRYLPLY